MILALATIGLTVLLLIGAMLYLTASPQQLKVAGKCQWTWPVARFALPLDVLRVYTAEAVATAEIAADQATKTTSRLQALCRVLSSNDSDAAFTAVSSASEERVRQVVGDLQTYFTINAASDQLDLLAGKVHEFARNLTRTTFLAVYGSAWPQLGTADRAWEYLRNVTQDDLVQVLSYVTSNALSVEQTDAIATAIAHAVQQPDVASKLQALYAPEDPSTTLERLRALVQGLVSDAPNAYTSVTGASRERVRQGVVDVQSRFGIPLTSDQVEALAAALYAYKSALTPSVFQAKYANVRAVTSSADLVWQYLNTATKLDIKAAIAEAAPTLTVEQVESIAAAVDDARSRVTRAKVEALY